MAKKEVEIDQNPTHFFAAGLQDTIEPLWRLGVWHGLPHYECLFCPFDTLDGEPAILEHWQQVHAAPAPEVEPERS